MAEWSDLMRSQLRDLRIGGRLVFGSGLEIALTGEMVSALTIEEGVDGPLLPGDVLCAGCTLDLVNDEGQWLEGGSLLGGQELIGATLAPQIGALDGNAVQWQPLGVFQVESAVVLEGQAVLRVKASDSVAFELADAFEDDGAYPASLADVWRRIVAQTRYEWNGNVPNGNGIVDAAPEWKNASLRTAMGVTAAAAGCFVRMKRDGSLELRRVQDASAAIWEFDPDCYLKLERDSASFGPVDALKITPEGEDVGEITFYATADQVDLYALSISGNPLFRMEGEHMRALAQGTANLLAGYGGTSLRFDWRGDPILAVGDGVSITDTAGKIVQGVLTRQTLRYVRGFSASCVCAVPDADSGVRRAITPEGGLNADALVGAVDGGLIRAGSVTTNKLAAGSITAEKLAVGAVDAGSISAITAKLKQIAAGKLTTDELYSAMAEIVVLSAGTASFDRATVQHLVAEALNLTFGVGDTVFIKNLSVDFAQMVSAQVGSLCIKASDGNYYTLDVDANGNVSATLTTVTEGEITAGTTSEGRVILETNIVASNLSTSNLLATFALINEIDAARIDVDQLFAREAFITKLATSLIIGGKSLTQIAGEVTDAQESADFATPYDSEEPPETAPAAGKIWIDRGTTPPIFRRWKGLDVSTDRDWGETSADNPFSFDNSDGRLDRMDGVSSTFSYTTGDGGRNLFDIDALAWGAPHYEADGSIVTLNSVGVLQVPARANTTYTISVYGTGYCRVARASAETVAAGNFIARSFIAAGETRTITTEPGTAYLLFAADSTITRVQLEYGSAATEWQAYSGSRRICGRKAASLTRCGKNLFSVSWEQGNIGSSTGSESANASLIRSGFVRVIPGKTYAITRTLSGGSFAVRCYDAYKNYLGLGSAGIVIVSGGTANNPIPSGGTTAVFTVNAGVHYLRFLDYTNNLSTRLQLEIANTPTAFEPYQAETFPAEFGETIYGAQIDWLKGTWKQTHYAYVLTGNETFTRSSYQGTYRWHYAPPDARRSAAASSTVCSHMTGSSWPIGNNGMDNHVGVYSVDGSIYLRRDSFTTEEEFKAWRKAQYDAGTPVVIVFQLAEPILHSFTPAQINFGAGTNYLFTDSGGDTVPALTLATACACSGWKTINSTSDIRSIQEQLQVQQQNAQAAIDELRTAVVTDNEGVHVRKVANDNTMLAENEVLITQKDVNIVSGGQRNSTFGLGYVRLLDMIIRVGGGGLVIEAAEE